MKLLSLFAAITVAAGCTRDEPKPRAPDLAPVEVCQHPVPAEVAAYAALDQKLAPLCDGLAAAVAAGRAFALPADAPPALAPLKPRLDEAARAGYECRAVASDDDAPCAQVAPVEKQEDCRLQRAFYHAARAANDPAWRFPDASLAVCKAAGVGAACDAYRDALRGRDPSRCPPGPPPLADCRALASGDPGKCADDRCRARVRRYQLVGDGGLARLATDGEPSERALAAAALAKPDACAAAKQTLIDVCRSAGHPDKK